MRRARHKPHHLRKAVRQGLFTAAKAHAARPRRGDAFGLTAADHLALGLGHVAEQIEYDVGNQRAGEVALAAGVQQRHVQHHDGYAPLPREHAPLFHHLGVVAPQPVDALDHQQIVPAQAAHQAQVLGPLKVPAGAPVGVEGLRRHAPRKQRGPLPLVALVAGRYANIAINHEKKTPFWMRMGAL